MGIHCRHWPLFGLCVSRYSSSPSSPGLITTQVRVRSTRGGFFAGFLGKFWTPSSSSQGSVGHSGHVLLFTEGEEKVLWWLHNGLRGMRERWGLRTLTTVFYIRQGWQLPVPLRQELPGVVLLFNVNLHIYTQFKNTIVYNLVQGINNLLTSSAFTLTSLV